jgi:hypothetical protein
MDCILLKLSGMLKASKLNIAMAVREAAKCGGDLDSPPAHSILEFAHIAASVSFKVVIEITMLPWHWAGGSNNSGGRSGS